MNKKKKMKKESFFLILGLFMVFSSLCFFYVLTFSSKEKKEPENEVMETINVQSQNEDYHTNLVDITVQGKGQDIEYVYISNTGFGIDEVRYFYKEKIFNWPIASRQDGKEHTIYITMVDKEGRSHKKKVQYKVD